MAANKVQSTAAAAARPPTPRPRSSVQQQLVFASRDENKDAQHSRSRRLSRASSSSSFWGDDIVAARYSTLPLEAEALKQQILRKWPAPLFRFRLRKMRRSVSLPVVAVPSDLAHARAWAARVSGINIPLTRPMFERQKSRLLERMPESIDECLVF